MPQPKEKQFMLNGFRYAAQLWGENKSIPAIALHGWLDNSASFDVLAPQLHDVQCLAIDLAGHGWSEHKKGVSDYPIWCEISAIYEIADQMGWDKFALIGHSRGAMISLLAAGVFPERISHLIMLDSIMPPVVSSEQAPERFRQSIKEIQQQLSRPLSLYKSFDQAINARCNSRYSPIKSISAKILATRGLREIDDKYHWHADGKLWAPSNVGLSYDMVSAFAQKAADYAVPSLLLLGKKGLIKIAEPESEFAQQCQQLATCLSAQVEEFDDGHFLHMEQAVCHVAKAINDFLLVEPYQ
jgi:pimeloyl-ACP methyl ester carboxylesterase